MLDACFCIQHDNTLHVTVFLFAFCKTMHVLVSASLCCRTRKVLQFNTITFSTYLQRDKHPSSSSYSTIMHYNMFN